MCGRITLRKPLNVLIQEFGLDTMRDHQQFLFEPRYNIAPTTDILTVRADTSGARTLALMRWGLIPSWAKEPASGPPLINARAETLAEKPAFRTAYRSRRCLIPADGFYEWQKTSDRNKQPFHIHMPDQGPFAFAGLWERWKGGPTIESCTVITTAANRALSSLHDRMPVVVAPSDYALWLNPAVTDLGAVEHLIASPANDDLIATPVSTHVNNVRNNDPQCVEPVSLDHRDTDPPRSPTLFGHEM